MRPDDAISAWRRRSRSPSPCQPARITRPPRPAPARRAADRGRAAAARRDPGHVRGPAEAHRQLGQGGRKLRGGAAEDAGDADAGRADALRLARVPAPADEGRRAVHEVRAARLPFPPTFMLLDIHRVLGTWLGPPPPSGERSGQVGDEAIHERWQDGKLIERTFVEREEQPARHDHHQLQRLRGVRFRDTHHAPECAPRLPDRHRHRAIPVMS